MLVRLSVRARCTSMSWLDFGCVLQHHVFVQHPEIRITKPVQWTENDSLVIGACYARILRSGKRKTRSNSAWISDSIFVLKGMACKPTFSAYKSIILDPEFRDTGSTILAFRACGHRKFILFGLQADTAKNRITGHSVCRFKAPTVMTT